MDFVLLNHVVVLNVFHSLARLELVSDSILSLVELRVAGGVHGELAGFGSILK